MLINSKEFMRMSAKGSVLKSMTKSINKWIMRQENRVPSTRLREQNGAYFPQQHHLLNNYFDANNQ